MTNDVFLDDILDYLFGKKENNLYLLSIFIYS